LSPFDATSLFIDARGDVGDSFAGVGVFHYEDSAGGWQQLSPFGAAQVSISGSGDVLAEFPGAGLWLHSDSSGWQNLTPADAAFISLAVG
jgi:hypothetical protein